MYVCVCVYVYVQAVAREKQDISQELAHKQAVIEDLNYMRK